MNKHLNIIIVEDDPINKKVTLLMLKKLGFRASALSNGLEILRDLEKKRYDLILMDIQMPGMNGIEATKIIRKRWPHKPSIVVITDCDSNIYRKVCLDAGANDFLPKPLMIDELRVVINRNAF